MLKAPLPDSAKTLWKKRSSDRLHLFTLANDFVRGAYVQANLVVEEMTANHKLGPFETYFLGQAYIAALVMASSLKGESRLNLKLSTNGPLGGFSVDANAFGEVRGYLFENPIKVPSEWSKARFEDILGQGTLSVTMTQEGKRIPMTGSVIFDQGSLAQGIAHYYDQSEQTATAIDLSLPFGRDGKAEGAAGLLLQAMPGCPDHVWNTLAQRLGQLPSIGENAVQNHDPEALLQFWFGDAEPKMLDHRVVEFFCPCSKEKFQMFLAGLPDDEQKDILLNGPFPLETVCSNCASAYQFSREELAVLFSSKKS
ncbi:MAG: Hsp33 family molecular chaperone HslO [Spirochaetales bacterium]|nr:Hsp33 family molecular chaperone HslO [Spirochaetales bacterium]